MTLPGFGHVPSKFLTAAVLLALAIALLVFAAGRGRAARPRRKPAATTIGAGPTFVDKRPADYVAHPVEAPVAPFPHHDAAAPTDG